MKCAKCQIREVETSLLYCSKCNKGFMYLKIFFTGIATLSMNFADQN